MAIKQIKKRNKKKEKTSSYPEERNPFADEKNGHLVKEKKIKIKKIKNKSKPVKIVEEKKGRAISNLVAEDDNNAVVKTSLAPKEEINHPTNSPSSIPAYLRTGNTRILTSTERKDSKLRKKTSEGDIKTLHQYNHSKHHENNNPFEDIQEVETDHKAHEIDENETQKHHHNSRRHRTASVILSSRERKKKKRMRIINKFRKKKKQDKQDNPEIHVQDMSYNPKPAEKPADQTVKMRQQVEEVKGIMSERVAKELVDRHSKISEMLESTEKLEKFSERFAKSAHETNVKMIAEARCCGMFAKYRFCRYLCTCSMPFRKNKKKRNLPKQNGTNTVRAFADLSDDDHPYEINETSLLNSKTPELRETGGRHQNGFLRAVQNSPLLQKLNEHRGSSHSLRAIVQPNKFFQPTTETKTQKRNKGSRLRATSSMGDLSDLLPHSPNLDKNIRRSIASNIKQYEDEEMRRRAAELLLLDHN